MPMPDRYKAVVLTTTLAKNIAVAVAITLVRPS